MFHVYSVADRRVALETRGSKEKFWVHDDNFGRCLFKFPRAGSGEDWAEKIAECAAKALCIPCAEYQLASLTRENECIRGVLSVDMLANGEELVSGHSLLMAHTEYPGPDKIPRYDSKLEAYTLPTVRNAIEKSGIDLPSSIEPHGQWIDSASALFVGYLVLDAFIGNQDRHHENWGSIENTASKTLPLRRSLAPTFDHASSLGCRLGDQERGNRLRTNDKGYSVRAFCARAKSPFHDEGGNTRLHTHAAVARAATLCASAVSYWLERLESLRDDNFGEWMGNVPSDRMSPVAKDFTVEMLRANRDLLLERRTV